MKLEVKLDKSNTGGSHIVRFGEIIVGQVYARKGDWTRENFILDEEQSGYGSKFHAFNELKREIIGLFRSAQ